jgi:hypothetical protein
MPSFKRRETSFCTVGVAAFLFAWPDVRTEDDFEAKRKEVQSTLMGCMNPIRHGIDALMALQWTKASLLSSARDRALEPWGRKT